MYDKQIESVAENFDVQAIEGRIEFAFWHCMFHPYDCGGPGTPFPSPVPSAPSA